MLDRLQNWLSPAEAAPVGDLDEDDFLGLGSIAGDIEECSWNALLDDMDRFSQSFRSAQH
jgi:hypothetical protein